MKPNYALAGDGRVKVKVATFTPRVWCLVSVQQTFLSSKRKYYHGLFAGTLTSGNIHGHNRKRKTEQHSNRSLPLKSVYERRFLHGR